MWASGPPGGPRAGHEEVTTVPRVTLAGQLLALQLLILLGVIAGVTAVSVSQSAQSVRRAQTRVAASAAENVAANPVVRAGIGRGAPAQGSALPATAESLRTLSGSRSVLLVQLDGVVLTSADPAQVGTRLAFGDRRVTSGRSWSGLVTEDGVTSVSAQVPVQDRETGAVVGVAVVERDYPSLLQRLEAAAPGVLTYLGIAGGLGVAGSLLLARRVTRQTMGLQPREITRLVEHREAMLHGVKEGVIGLDPHDRVTLVNDAAATLLGLRADDVGRPLADLGLDPALVEVLTGRRTGTDLVVLVEDRVVTLNRNHVVSRGRPIGSVTTLRDRTELVTLRGELGVVRDATDTLRAQTHEFANRLHVISGLIQLGEYDQVVSFVDTVVRDRAEVDGEVAARVLDPAVAALLVAKTSLATERGVRLRFAVGARLGRVDDELSADLTTVVGNLVDNALDAVTAAPCDDPAPWVEVDLREDGDEVVVVVRDSGPGVADAIAGRVFDRGFSTKDGSGGVGRGFGLALTGLVCRRRGGEVGVRNDEGAVFTARLPRALVPA